MRTLTVILALCAGAAAKEPTKPVLSVGTITRYGVIPPTSVHKVSVSNELHGTRSQQQLPGTSFGVLDGRFEAPRRSRPAQPASAANRHRRLRVLRDGSRVPFK